MTIGAGICGLSSEIALSGFAGGVIGILVGIGIAAALLVIRKIYNFVNKKEQFMGLIKKSEKQYNSIIKGIKFTVKTKIEESQHFIEDLINNITTFLNKEISLIQNEKWISAKKELIFISDKFEKLYGRNK